REAFGSESGDGDAYGNVADAQGFGQFVPMGLFHPLRTDRRFYPFDEPVALGQSLNLTDAALAAAGMQAHDTVYAALEQQAVLRERAKAPIGQHNVFTRQHIPKLAPEGSLVFGKRAGGRCQQRAGRQGKQGDEAHHRKTASGRLARWLRIAILIGGGIGHRAGTAIDDADAAPGEPRRLLGVEMTYHARQRLVQVGLRQSGACLAVGRSIGRKLPCLPRPKPALRLAHRFAARLGMAEHLGQEEPERDPRRKHARAGRRLVGGAQKRTGRLDERGYRQGQQTAFMKGQRTGHDHSPLRNGLIDAVITCMITCNKTAKKSRKKMGGKNAMNLAELQRRHERLKRSLLALGPTLQGSILRRVIQRPDPEHPRHAKDYGPYYQWTRKL